MNQSTSQDSIVKSAMSLFAQLGYDGTDLELVAASAGVGKATVVELFGTRRELYLQVMEYAYGLEMETLGPLFDGFGPTAEGIDRLVDGYLDVCLTHPAVPTLWMHRWLGDAADIEHLEEIYSRPLHSALGTMLDGVLAPDVDVELAVWTVVWSVHGFVSARQAGRFPAEIEERVRDFRLHLRGLTRRFVSPLTSPDPLEARGSTTP